ncbi:MAG: hypothetical protein ABIU97_06745 [Dehalococcoidia bacterium]
MVPGHPSSEVANVIKLQPLLMALAIALGGCSLAPSPAALPPVLYVENRGGPAFVVRIAGEDGDGVTMACDSGTALTPGQRGVPILPWDLTVTQVQDGAVLLATQVTSLPRWLVLIGGDDLGGLSTVAVAGPPGPTCPPSG